MDARPAYILVSARVSVVAAAPEDRSPTLRSGKTMVRWQSILILILVALCTGGSLSCMEVIRRAEPDKSKPEPWWTEPGNPSESESLGSGEVASTPASPLVDGDPAVDRPVDPPRAATVETSRQSLAEAHAKRGRSLEESTKRINEYAYWCIENNMWDEARLHLERAVSQDSLAASLFNNLGVIYERLGETAQADSAYARATALLSESQAYAANLSRLRKRAEAATRAIADSVSEVSNAAESAEAAASSGNPATEDSSE